MRPASMWKAESKGMSKLLGILRKNNIEMNVTFDMSTETMIVRFSKRGVCAVYHVQTFGIDILLIEMNAVMSVEDVLIHKVEVFLREFYKKADEFREE